MDASLESVIERLRTEFDRQKLFHGEKMHAAFELKIDIQDGNVVHGILNGIRFRIDKTVDNRSQNGKNRR